MNKYEERYISFLDILGFSSLIERTEKDEVLLERLVSVLKEQEMYTSLSEYMDSSSLNDPEGFFLNMFRMSTFSDSIVISTQANLLGLGLISTMTAIICNRLLHQGVFTRGAISKGNIIHTNSVVLGPGLINTYNLENKAAIYPRILIDECVVSDMDALSLQGGSPELRRKDFDGLFHLHILHTSIMDLTSHTLKSEYENLENHEYMALGRREIEEALCLNKSNLTIKAKIVWLANYYNDNAVDFDLPKIDIEGELKW